MFHHRWYPDISGFPNFKHLCEIPMVSPPTGALITGGVYKFCDFRPIFGFIRETIQDKTIVTMEQ